MKIRPGRMLAALAAVSWGTFITADALNWHVHILWCTLVIAGIATVLAFQWLMISHLRQALEQQNAAYKELAQAVASLLTDPKTPGAPPLRSVGGRQ